MLKSQGKNFGEGSKKQYLFILLATVGIKTIKRSGVAVNITFGEPCAYCSWLEYIFKNNKLDILLLARKEILQSNFVLNLPVSAV